MGCSKADLRKGRGKRPALPYKVNKTRKPKSMEHLLIKIRAWFLYGSHRYTTYIPVGRLAERYMVERHYINQCLEVLKREGLVIKAHNKLYQINSEGISYYKRHRNL